MHINFTYKVENDFRIFKLLSYFQFYLTPPTKQHHFSKNEVGFMLEEVPGFKPKFASFITDDTLTGNLYFPFNYQVMLIKCNNLD